MIRRIRRFWFAALWLVWPAVAAPPLTTIQDVLYKADGTRFNGTLTISWSSFQAIDNSSIVMQSAIVRVQDGLLRVQLVPNTTSTPAGVYTVTYNSDGRVQFQEFWSVPSSMQTLHVRDVRTAAPSSGSATTGADTSGSSVLESSVVGLIADLGARPVKSPAFAPGRTAVVDSSGLISTAAGSATDCVHVDGSSGPCGAIPPSFVDGESLTGIVDGSNHSFGVSAVPDPVTSLAVYRNGVLQKTAQDYTLSGSTVTFVAAATPQPGDTLMASYRVMGLQTGTGSGASFTAPQVLCSGAGAGTNSPTLAALATCSIPAGLLAPGDRVEIRFDYAHQGTGGGVSLEVDWGGTVLAHRDAAAGETLITGRGDAAILTSGARLSAQSWGVVLAFAAGVANATDGYGAGLTVNFRGSAAQSGDAVTLNNFTVVRLP